jgi:hypothetical protein
VIVRNFRLGRELLSSFEQYDSSNNEYNNFYIQNNRGDIVLAVDSDGYVTQVNGFDAIGQLMVPGG